MNFIAAKHLLKVSFIYLEIELVLEKKYVFKLKYSNS